MSRPAPEVDVQSVEVYAYGLVPAGSTLPDGLEGVTGRAVETIDLDGVAAVVSREVDAAELGLAEDLLAHTRVLDAIARGVDVVPLVFGTMLPLTAPFDGARTDLLATYRDASRRVQGALQYTLTVRYVQQVALTELVAEDPRIARLRELTAGTGEHEARAEKLRLGKLVVDGLEAKAAQEAARVLTAVGPATRAMSRRERRAADEIVEVAVLVERDAVERFTERCEGLAAELDGRATVRLLGPQAPYDFVQETDRWAS